MTITTGTQIALSGTVTREDMLALGTDHVDVVDNIYVRLKKAITIAAGTDLQLQGLGIIVNDQGIGYVDASANDNPVIEGVAFVYNIGSHWRASRLRMKDCALHGCPGGGIFSVASVENLQVLSNRTSAPSVGTELFFMDGGVFEGVTFSSSGRLGVSGTESELVTYWLRNIAVLTQTTLRMGYNYAPSAIFQDVSAPDATDFVIDTFRAGKRAHTLMLLGHSVATFYRGSSEFDRTNAHGNTRVLAGGIKYWAIQNSDGAAVVEVYDSRDNTQPARSVPSLDNWELLADTRSIAVPADGNVAFIMASGVKAGTNNTSQLDAVTDHSVHVKAYGKQPLVLTYNDSAEVIATEGAETAYIPKLLLDDANITNADTTQVAAYGIAVDHAAQTITISGSHTLDDLYDALMLDYTTRQSPQRFIASVSAATLGIGSYDLTVSGSLAAGSRLEQLTTTGTVGTENHGAVSCPYVDSTQNAAVTVIGLPEGADITVRNRDDTATLVTGQTPFNYGYNSGDDSVWIKATYTQDGVQKQAAVNYQLAPGTSNEVGLTVGALETIDSAALVGKLWSASSRSLTDKTGFAPTQEQIRDDLTTTQRRVIAAIQD